MPRIPIPFAHYPRSGEDLTTLDERLGGRTSMVIGPRKQHADGSLGRAEYVEFWIEYQQEFIPPGQPAPKAPSNPAARQFLKELAKRSASAWVAEVSKAKGW